MVELGRRLHGQGMISGADGNLSVRLSPRVVLTTPTGLPKGRLHPRDMVKVDLDTGRVIGKGRPSSELRMHLLVYRTRPDVGAILHAHPVHVVALSLVGEEIDSCVLPELALSLGKVATAPYSTPTTDEVPRAVASLVPWADAIVLERHGAVTLGADLEQAFLRMESLEHAARTISVARAMGTVTRIGGPGLQRLEALAREFGRLPGDQGLCDAKPRAEAMETLVQRVLERLNIPSARG